MAEPTPPEIKTASGILKENSQETAEELSLLTASLEEALANTLLNMSEEERVETLKAIRQLNNGIFARGASQNLRKPEMITTALKGAASLVSPEPLLKTEAQQMVDALRESYDIE